MKIIYLTIISLVIFISCSEQGTTPTTEQLKDPREMIWTADTLKMPDTAIQLIPEDMLVVSPNDIWLAVWVGHGQIWHYDGKTWTVVEDIGGEVDCLVKKSETELWAGGRIGRSDGNNVAVAKYKNGAWIWDEMNIKGEILDMCTDPQGNVWACGRNGIIMKYSNNKWVVDTIKIKINAEVSYWLQSIEFHDGKIYVLASTADKLKLTETYYYFIGDLKNFVAKDSMTLGVNSNKWGYRKLYSLNFKNLYSIGIGGIWQLQTDSWLKLQSFDGAINEMYGIKSNYLILAGDFKKLIFFDGVSWVTISNLFKISDSYFKFNSIWSTGQDLFICGYGTINNKNVTILWHGK
jgi:hypothetical protein